MSNLSNQENVLSSDIDPSFFQSSRPGSRAVFRELSTAELSTIEEELINKLITTWSTDISLLPLLSHSKIKDYMIDATIMDARLI